METPLGCIWHNLNQGQFHAAVQIHRRIRRPRPPHPQHHPQKPRRHRFPHRPALPFDVNWQIDNGLQTVTKTFHSPFTKVDRESDYARTSEVFELRYGTNTPPQEDDPEKAGD